MAFFGKRKENAVHAAEPAVQASQPCRFTAAGVEEIDYKDLDTCATSCKKTARSSRLV